MQIKALFPNEYRYICKYDKEWMNSVLPQNEHNDNKNKGNKVNWDERDNTYLKLVEEKCKEIYNRIPYQRVAKSIIGKELGIINMLYNSSNKIPKTIHFIKDKNLLLVN